MAQIRIYGLRGFFLMRKRWPEALLLVGLVFMAAGGLAG